MSTWAGFNYASLLTPPPRKASRQRALKFRLYDPRLPFRSAAPKRRSPSGRRAPPVLRAVPSPHRRTLDKLNRQKPEARRRAPYHFTDIGTVGTVPLRDDASGKFREFARDAQLVPIVGHAIGTALSIAADVVDAFSGLLGPGNAAGLSPQQLDAINAGIKKGGVAATGSVLNRVEGRAGTKQLFDPDAPGGYRTVGGRFAD